MIASDRIRVMLLKPWQPTKFTACIPPLGLLQLVSTIRERLGDRAEIRFIDCKLESKTWREIGQDISEFRPHIIGLSSLNWEADESARIARVARQIDQDVILALGGPYAHRNQHTIAADGLFDWIFDGPADWAFPEAVERQYNAEEDLSDIFGLTWRQGDGTYMTNPETADTGIVDDLNAIPLAAWDLIDFERYAKRVNFNYNLRGKYYAPIFTSRGCPFLCTYCHDIFGKKFIGRSVENVMEEIHLLHDKYGVDEFQIVDDIFNMNSPRMKAICREIAKLDVHITFPNGLRADILDEEGVQCLADAGMYECAVAIETVTPRLQEMIKKRLKLNRTMQAVKWMTERDILVKGFFMIGFPTETLDEIKATIDFACKSDLTFAGFFHVVPQPGTPIHEWAKKENPAALERVLECDQYAHQSWYNLAYGINIGFYQRWAFFRFYLLSPRRVWRLFSNMPKRELLRYFYVWLNVVFTRGGKVLDEKEPTMAPESIIELSGAVKQNEGQSPPALAVTTSPKQEESSCCSSEESNGSCDSSVDVKVVQIEPSKAL
ncbi:MAG: radical SAM protein [Pirellulales bacterium]